MNDRVYKTKREKYKAVIEEIEEMVKEGRPVLVVPLRWKSLKC